MRTTLRLKLTTILAALVLPVAAVSPALAGTSAAKTTYGPVERAGSYFGDHTSADNGKSKVPQGITIPDPSPVAQIGTSNSTQYALLADGSVYAWGQGTNGELGDGLTVNSFTTAVQVQFPPQPDGSQTLIASIPTDADPYDSAFAISTTGTLYGWGLNPGGVLCIGSQAMQPYPVAASFTSPVAEVAAANEHMLAYAGGTVYSCGTDNNGVAGTGVYGSPPATSPQAVTGLPDESLVTGVYESYDNAAVLDGGTLYTFGMNSAGQLGTGSTARKDATPQPVTLPGDSSGIVQAAVGGSSGANGQSVVMTAAGNYYAWGVNTWGEDGTGTAGGFYASPVQFTPPVPYVALASGGGTDYGITADGTLYGWGDGQQGELADGSTASSAAPVAMFTGVSLVSATAADVAWDNLAAPARKG